MNGDIGNIKSLKKDNKCVSGIISLSNKDMSSILMQLLIENNLLY